MRSSNVSTTAIRCVPGKPGPVPWKSEPDWAHLSFEDYQAQDYHIVELNQELVDRFRSRFPQVKAIVGDCQKRMDFPDEI